MKCLINKKDLISAYLISEVKIISQLKLLLTEYKKVTEELSEWLDSDEEYFYLNTRLKNEHFIANYLKAQGWPITYEEFWEPDYLCDREWKQYVIKRV